MTFQLQITLIVCLIGFFIVILHLLKKQALQLRYIIIWLFTGAVMLLLAIFPNILNAIAKLVGIYDPTNGLFAMMIFFILIMLLSITSIVSLLTNQNKKVAQQLALLEKRVREVECCSNECNRLD